jgi:ribosomal protein S18 acetylase RimI-like enzyme
VLRWTGSVNATTRGAMPEAIEINNLMVRPAYRRRGIGSLLIAASEHHARERGRHLITLAVGADNPDASRLYERLGYARTGLRVTDRYTYAGEQIVEHSDVLVKTV